MTENDLSQLQRERTFAGQRELANAMRTLMRRSAPEIYEVVRDLGDSFFLEPALFTHFARTERDSILGLPQILFGRIPAEARPDAVEVDSDRHGRVYLPGIGTLSTERRQATLGLTWDRESGQLSLLDGESGVPFLLEAEQCLAGTNIELVRYEDPTLLTRFYDVQSNPAAAEIDGRSARHRRSIERALDVLREYCPDYMRELLSVTRRIVIFKGSNINSFATINAHGVAFFNALDIHDEVYFVDELVHQCGHIIFNAMTVRRRDFMAADPEVSLSTISPREASNRKLYDAFHGLYTEDVMSECMRTIDEREVFSGAQAHELFGRLSFIARKFRVDLRNLSGPGVFTELGQKMYDRWVARFDRLVSERPELLETDLVGQPYNFDVELFARRNAPRTKPAPGVAI